MCNVIHHTGTNYCIKTFKTVMCHIIQAHIIQKNFQTVVCHLNCNGQHLTGTNCTSPCTITMYNQLRSYPQAQKGLIFMLNSNIWSLCSHLSMVNLTSPTKKMCKQKQAPYIPNHTSIFFIYYFFLINYVWVTFIMTKSIVEEIQRIFLCSFH